MSDSNKFLVSNRSFVGRGTSLNTHNRFEAIYVEPEWTHFETAEDDPLASSKVIFLDWDERIERQATQLSQHHS